DHDNIDDELFSNPNPKATIAKGERSHNPWCMVGYLRSRTEPFADYLLIVNKDAAGSHSFHVGLFAAADSILKVSSSDGSLSFVAGGQDSITTSTLPAGTGELYKV